MSGFLYDVTRSANREWELFERVVPPPDWSAKPDVFAQPPFSYELTCGDPVVIRNSALPVRIEKMGQRKDCEVASEEMFFLGLVVGYELGTSENANESVKRRWALVSSKVSQLPLLTSFTGDALEKREGDPLERSEASKLALAALCELAPRGAKSVSKRTPIAFRRRRATLDLDSTTGGSGSGGVADLDSSDGSGQKPSRSSSTSNKPAQKQKSLTTETALLPRYTTVKQIKEL